MFFTTGNDEGALLSQFLEQTRFVDSITTIRQLLEATLKFTETQTGQHSNHRIGLESYISLKLMTGNSKGS